MTLLEIQNKLNDRFKDRVLDSAYSYSNINAYSIGCVGRSLVEDEGADPNQIILRDERNTVCRVCYKNYTLFTITIKKSKGRCHHNYDGTSGYDWTIKDIEVTSNFMIEDVDLAAAINEINELSDKAALAKTKKDQCAIEIIEHIMRAYKLKDYDACYMCDYIAENKYSLMNKLKFSNMY